MSLQRRRGEPIVLYPSKWTTNERGDRQRSADLDSPQRVVGKMGHIRSAEAEMPGQLVTSNDYLLVPPDAVIDAHGAAFVRGQWWDIDGPPVHVGGTRHTKHQVVGIRLRPPGSMNG